MDDYVCDDCLRKIFKGKRYFRFGRKKICKKCGKKRIDRVFENEQ